MKGYRTIALNVLAALVPILQMTEIINIIPVEYLDWYMVGIAAANVVMRMITTTPVGRA